MIEESSATPPDARSSSRCSTPSAGRSGSLVVGRRRTAGIRVDLRTEKKAKYTGAITTKGKWKSRIFAWYWRFVDPADVKIKVGMPGCDDVKRLKMFRRIMPRLKFRIDANEAWTAAAAAERIRELEPFGISLVEQPVKHEEVACAGGSSKAVKTPIMLDESLCSMIDAERAVEAAGATCSTSGSPSAAGFCLACDWPLMQEPRA